MKWPSSRWQVIGITLLATALRLCQLGAKSFWFDECFTRLATLAPLGDSLAALLVAGIYSPLYFLLLRPATALAGVSEYAFRFLSAACGVLAIPAIYQLGRKLIGETGGVAAALLLAACPFHIWYSQDARMYAPMALFSVLAMDRFVLLQRNPRRWIFFSVGSGLAYLMHYASFSLLYVQLIHLLPRLRETRLVRRWLLAQVVAFIPLMPWLAWYVASGARPTGLGWIPSPGLLAPLQTLWNFVTADTETITLPVVVLMVGIALVFLRGFFPWNEDRRLLAWWLALPIGSLFLLSLCRPYYVDRYLMASLPAYLLLLSSGIMAWRRVTWRIAALAVTLIAMLWGTSRLYADPLFAKEEWRGATAAIEAGLAQDDVVLAQDQETLIGTSVYRTREWPRVVLSEESSWTIEAMTARYKRVWLVWRSPREYNHRLSKSDPFDVFAEASPPVRAWLAAHQDQVALDLRLPGLSVVRVDRER
jgi:mannosyltransferase